MSKYIKGLIKAKLEAQTIEKESELKLASLSPKILRKFVNLADLTHIAPLQKKMHLKEDDYHSKWEIKRDVAAAQIEFYDEVHTFLLLYDEIEQKQILEDYTKSLSLGAWLNIGPRAIDARQKLESCFEKINIFIIQQSDFINTARVYYEKVFRIIGATVNEIDEGKIDEYNPIKQIYDNIEEIIY